MRTKTSINIQRQLSYLEYFYQIHLNRMHACELKTPISNSQLKVVPAQLK